MSDETSDNRWEQRLSPLIVKGGVLPAPSVLLRHAGELMKLMGDVRSELFHYEVRATYDTPEVAESRRIVNDAIQQADQGTTWQSSEWTEDGDDAPEW